MPRTCTVCRHEQRADIEKALIVRQPFRHIAAQYKVSTSALVRHSDDHLPKSLLKARDAAEVAAADNILAQMQDLRDRALAILTEAEKAGDLRTALGAIREGCRCVELLGRLAGELQEGATVNILVSPQWLRVQTVVLGALDAHPEARASVADALAKMEAAGHA